LHLKYLNLKTKDRKYKTEITEKDKEKENSKEKGDVICG
jgi:hypothetical protein